MPERDPAEERALIVSGRKRPYGARLEFQVLTSHSIGEADNVTLLLHSGAIATIEPGRSAPWEGGRRLVVRLEGFPTAAIAETEGVRLAQALLLSAISLNFGLRLIYDGREPAVVYERFRSKGFETFAVGVAGWSDVVAVSEITDAFRCKILQRKVLLSMELYCSALVELNERTQFVTVVSALEPLAEQLDLDQPVASYVDQCLSALDDAGGIGDSLRSSLRGRVLQLRQESVRQALHRLANAWFPGRPDIRDQIDRAYALRSELVHKGALSDRDIDLATEAAKVRNLLRSLYEMVSERPLRAKAT
jgi:Apea-like HEPN